MTDRYLRTGDEDLLIAAYRAGDTIRKVAADHGVSDVTVHKVLNRRQIPRRRRTGLGRKEFTQDELDRLARLRLDGWSKDELRDEFQCGPDRLNAALKDLGLGGRMVRRDRKERRSAPGGYIYARLDADDPMVSMATGSSRYVFEHRLVMARSLGRTLATYETVHHINGDKQDNRLENLQLRSGRHGKHAAYQCADCGSRNVVPTTLL